MGKVIKDHKSSIGEHYTCGGSPMKSHGEDAMDDVNKPMLKTQQLEGSKVT